MNLIKLITEIFTKHQHTPRFDDYERRFGGGKLSARWAMYYCLECNATGHREEWPQEDRKIIWFDKE